MPDSVDGLVLAADGVATRERLRRASRQPVRPPGTPSSSSAVSVRGIALRSAAALDQRELRQRIDQEVELEIRMLVLQADHSRDLGAPTQLIGHDDAAHAEAHADGELLYGGDGDAPGAGGELLREDLRRHRRLAVRRQQHAGRAR